MRTAAADWNVRFGSLGVLSELSIAHGITPDAWTFSDKTDLKIDRASHQPDNPANSHTERAGQGQSGSSVNVKLLRLQSRSERKLVAIKQVCDVLLQVESRELHLSRGFTMNRRGGSSFHIRT